MFAQTSQGLAVLGWREWVGLPQFGIDRLRAKVDTGARSSALHVDAHWECVHDGVAHVGFVIHRRRGVPRQHEGLARVCDRRSVADSSGRQTERIFIQTRLHLAGAEREIEISLTDRGDMLFPFLIGRTALRDMFLVDPSQSFLHKTP